MACEGGCDNNLFFFFCKLYYNKVFYLFSLAGYYLFIFLFISSSKGVPSDADTSIFGKHR